MSDTKKERNVWIASIVLLLFVAGVALLLYWLFIARFYVYTEDAYVHGNEVMLKPQVTAAVAAIFADETDLVCQGQIVVELDPSNHMIYAEERQKVLANTVREVAALFKDVGAKEAAVKLKEAQLIQAKLDYQHREPLVKTGAVSTEEFETYHTNVDVAKAALDFAEKELEAAKVLVLGTTVESHPRVQEAVWNLKQAYLDLIRCQIWSPVNGYVAKRSVQVGDQVSIGKTLLYIVPLNEIWVEANFKETSLKKVRIGQQVKVTADLYGRGKLFHGKVVGFQPGSGNAFSLLPPEMASGNWIKIIQRVPVRIALDLEEIRKNPLFLGLSMRVTIDVHDIQGDMIAHAPTCRPIYTTEIYQRQLEELSQIAPLIDTLIKQNQ